MCELSSASLSTTTTAPLTAPCRPAACARCPSSSPAAATLTPITATGNWCSSSNTRITDFTGTYPISAGTASTSGPDELILNIMLNPLPWNSYQGHARIGLPYNYSILDAPSDTRLRRTLAG